MTNPNQETTDARSGTPPSESDTAAPEPGTRSPAGRATRAGASLPNLIDIPTVAEHLGTSPRHIRRLVAERRIPYLKLGHYVRFDPDELDAWLDDHRVKTIGSTNRLR